MKKELMVSVGLKNCMEDNFLTIVFEKTNYVEVTYELDEKEIDVLEGLIKDETISSVEDLKNKLEEMGKYGSEYEIEGDEGGDLDELNPNILDEINLFGRLS